MNTVCHFYPVSVAVQFPSHPDVAGAFPCCSGLLLVIPVCHCLCAIRLLYN